MNEKKLLGLERNVFFLGMVSFFNDISSEMTLTLLPLFLANVLGVPTSVIGLIEGLAEATASLLKVASGWFSDRIKARKGLALAGYTLSAFSKPFLAIAGNWPAVLVIRWLDRVGKGIRTSPRDALLADSASSEGRGKAFGWHRAADTSGAVIGLAGAAVVVALTQRGKFLLTQSTYRDIVLIGMIPGFLAVAILFFLVRERKPGAHPSRESTEKRRPAEFPATFYLFLGVIVIFTLGNSSDAFLVLRAQNVGMSALGISLMLVGFNIFYALISMPSGSLSDRWGRRLVILLGWGVYATTYLGFAIARSVVVLVAFYFLYGIYYGVTEGTARALVADLVPSEGRATAYGLYHAAVGLSAFPASFIAGVLWDKISPAAPFYLGAILAGVAALAFALLPMEGKT